VVAVAALVALAGFCPSARADDANLTGTWVCDDEGTYYLRQVGNTVWWLGKSKDGGKSWTNVFRGTIKDNRIVGDWADVPQGESDGAGTLTLEIVLDGARVVELRKKRQVGDDFGGTSWRRP
jgi:hypothetical protein